MLLNTSNQQIFSVVLKFLIFDLWDGMKTLVICHEAKDSYDLKLINNVGCVPMLMQRSK